MVIYSLNCRNTILRKYYSIYKTATHSAAEWTWLSRYKTVYLNRDKIKYDPHFGSQLGSYLEFLETRKDAKSKDTVKNNEK